MQRAGVLTWTRMQVDPYDERIRDKAEEEIWVYPKDLYARYRSATLHKRVWQGLSVVVALISILWLGWLFLIKPSSFIRHKEGRAGGRCFGAGRCPGALGRRHAGGTAPLSR